LVPAKKSLENVMFQHQNLKSRPEDTAKAKTMKTMATTITSIMATMHKVMANNDTKRISGSTRKWST